MYEKERSSTAVLEQDRFEGRQTVARDNDCGTAVGTREEGGRGTGSEARALRFHVIIAGLIAVLFLCGFILAQIVHLSGVWQIFERLEGAYLAMPLSWYCWWARHQRLKESCLISLWAVLATNAIVILVQVAGCSRAILVDGTLAQIDGALGLSTGAVVAWVKSYEWLASTLWVVYWSLPLMILAALFVPILFGHLDHSRRFLLSVVIAAVITIALFATWPAVGPWSIYGFAPTAQQLQMDSYLHSLKLHHPMAIDWASSSIVSFPSFHVVLALLSAAALRPIRLARWFAEPLAALICISTITTGWHYCADMLGGMVVAGMSAAIASRFLK
jgi:PAP2 superfamily